MRSLLCLTILIAVCKTGKPFINSIRKIMVEILFPPIAPLISFIEGLGLECWTCNFSGDPEKAYLLSGSSPNIDNSTYSIYYCSGSDPACVKAEMSKFSLLIIHDPSKS